MHSKYISKFKALLVCLCLLCGWQLQADWSDPINLSPSGGTAQEPQISVNNSGHAMAIWQRLEDSISRIQVSYFDGSDWSEPFNLSVAGQNPTGQKIAFNNEDQAIAVWRANTSQVIEAAYFNEGTWSSVSQLSASGQSSSVPRISINNSGHAFAVWHYVNNSIGTIQTSFFNGSVWSEEAINLSDPEVSSLNPELSLNNLGNAMVVWSGTTGMRAAFYNGTSWASPADLSLGQASGVPRLSRLTSSNKAIAVWKETNDGQHVMRASVFNGSSWSTSTVFSGVQNFDDYRIDLNDSDHALAIWRTSSSPIIIRSSFFNGTDWSNAYDLSTGQNSVLSPKISLNNSGEAIAVWRYTFGTLTIAAASFTAPAAPNPPQDLLGVKESNQFVFQTAFYNQLSWSASSSEEVTAYHIYRDDVLIGTVLADNVLVFTDRSIDWRLSYVYGVKAVNGEDVESSAVTVEIHP